MKYISDFTISCTEEQTRKALELGAPIQLWSEYYKNQEHDFKLDTPIPCRQFTNGYCAASCPTAEQLIGWLRTKGCTPYVYPVMRDGRSVLSARLLIKLDNGNSDSFYGFGEDYSIILAAIDAALEYLTNNK